MSSVLSKISSAFVSAGTTAKNNFKENVKVQSTAGKVARVAGTLALAGAAVASFLFGGQALALTGLFSAMASSAIVYGTGLVFSALAVSIPLAVIAVRHPKAQQDVNQVELTTVASTEE